MPRISGVDVPENKRIDVALTYVYGLGRVNVKPILTKAEVSGAKRAKELTGEEVSRLQKAVDALKVEGDLRKEVRQNIARLKEIGSYRGQRHNKN